MTSIKGQSELKENNFFFWFWLTAGENIDSVTYYLANNKIFWDNLVDFCVKHTFL